MSDLQDALRTIWRWRVSAAMAFVALVFGSSIATLVFATVANEFSYDTWVPDWQEVYRIDTTVNVPGQSPIETPSAPGPLLPALAGETSIVRSWTRIVRGGIAVVEGGASRIRTRVAFSDQNFFSFFGLSVIKLKRNARLAPDQIAISETYAKNLFGESSNALAKVLTINGKAITISAVFADIPLNSHLNLTLVGPLDSVLFGGRAKFKDAWDQPRGYHYIRVARGVGAEVILRQAAQTLDKHFKTPAGLPEGTRLFRFETFSLPSLHLFALSGDEGRPKGDPILLAGMTLVAGLILAVAVSNYAIVAMAIANERRAEIAVRRVLGANWRNIWMLFFVPALMLALLASAVSVLLLLQFGRVAESLLGLLVFQSVTQLVWVAVFAALLALFVAAIATLYPAWLAWRQNNRTDVSRRRGPSTSGNVAQNILLTVELATAIACFGIAAAVFAQLRFVTTVSRGFSTDHLVAVRNLPSAATTAEVTSFISYLRSTGVAAAVAASTNVPGRQDVVIASNVSPPAPARPSILRMEGVGPEFFEVYAVRPVAGRVFQVRDGRTFEAGSMPRIFVANEAAVRALGWSTAAASVGQVLRWDDGAAYEIVGVVPNLQFGSARDRVEPTIYHLNLEEARSVTAKVIGPLSNATKKIAMAAERFFPGKDVELLPVSVELERLSDSEDRQFEMLSLGTVGTVLISLVGVFGVASRTVRSRLPEIAIRRIHGASALQVTARMLLHFAPVVVAATLLASVAVAYASDWWYSQFASRADLPWLIWLFGWLSLVFVSTIPVLVRLVPVLRTSPAATLRMTLQ